MRASLLAALSLPLAGVPPAFAEVPAGLVQKLKPSIVNVEKSVTVGLETEGGGRSKASAFIVDAKRGILATNRHVSGVSPARFKIVFENGQSAEARILHHDAWHDFALLKLDMAGIDFPLEQVELGESSGLKEQQDVVMIGNNDAQEYSVKFGKVSNLVLDKGQRHSATIQTTFDRAGGSSGSPVFDEKGRVVALHFAGTDTTSFELKVEYLRDALGPLQRGGRVLRGEAGLDLKLLFESDARKHFGLPDDVAKKIRALRTGLKHVVAVESRVPGTRAEKEFLPGDVIVTVDGQWIGDDLYRFDRIVDSKAGGEVAIGAYRNGKSFEVRLPVGEAEASKITKFARFGGGVLHDPTPELRLDNNISASGVFLSQAEAGSSFSTLGNELGRGSQRYLTLVEGVNGIPTPDLEAFVAAVRPLKDRDEVYFLVRDQHSHNTNIQAVPVKLDLRFSPLTVSEWSPETLDWTERKPADAADPASGKK